MRTLLKKAAQAISDAIAVSDSVNISSWVVSEWREVLDSLYDVLEGDSPAPAWQPLPAPPQADETCECNGQGWVEVADAQVIDCPGCTGKAAEVDHD